jgi:hypothetical protein
MAGQFYGLLWGNRMLGLLLGACGRAFLRLYPPKP